jgi:hypothetical protein
VTLFSYNTRSKTPAVVFLKKKEAHCLRGSRKRHLVRTFTMGAQALDYSYRGDSLSFKAALLVSKVSLIKEVRSHST